MEMVIMKKIILIFLLFVFVLPATYTYAAGKDNPRDKNLVTEKVQNTNEKNINLEKLVNVKDKNVSPEKAQAKAIQAELKVLQNQISTNRTKLVNMKKEATNAYNKAVNKLKKLRKNKDNMTQEQLDLIVEAANSLQLDGKALEDTSGELNGMYSNLQSISTGTNYQLIKQTMNDIINLQIIRINNLQQAITDLNRIANL